METSCGSISFCMRYFLFIYLLSIMPISCGEISGNTEKSISEKPKKDSSSSFVCNYPAYKEQSKKLYSLYRNKPDTFSEKPMLHFIHDSLFTCWLGTPWDFYGTSEEPGKGKIACGYFVTTLLRDMGVPVQRVKYAQCASEEMIRAVCNKKTIYRYSNTSLPAFVQTIRSFGSGLYIVGLDNHTGFILNDGEEIYFIHSTYVGKRAVIKEKAIESGVLASSKYKVIDRVM